jgi:formylglycine-generating enzyme required for sulfatase activity
MTDIAPSDEVRARLERLQQRRRPAGDGAPATTDGRAPGVRPRAARLARPLAAVVVALLLVAGSLWFATDRFRGDPATPPADPRGMIVIPSASYIIGAANPGSDELAAQFVAVPRFALDRVEVRNGDYERFLQSHGAIAAPATWNGRTTPRGRVDEPVVGVTYEAASEYCASLDKRLPTEAEWEIAARGTTDRRYPWGDDLGKGSLPARGTYAVGTVAANESTFGIRDLAGNAWEWVGTPAGAVAPRAHVLRGGSNRTPLRVTQRVEVMPEDTTSIEQAGLRCAADTIDTDFYDDFSDPASGWPVRDDESVSLGYEPPSSYAIELRGPAATTQARAGLDIADATISAAIALAAQPGTTVRYGIEFRASGRGSYVFALTSPSREWMLISRRGDGGSVLRHGAVATMSIGTTDRLRVELHGAQLDLFVNDTFVARLDDRTYDRGDTGIYVQTLERGSARVNVDDFGSTWNAAAP